LDNPSYSSSRGKWLVAVILAGSLLFLAFALWYFLTQSPPDQRFNMARDSVPASAQITDLLPSELDDFSRNGSLVAAGSNGSSATYVNTNDNTHRAALTVKAITPPTTTGLSDALKAATCGDGSGTSTVHADAHPPFAYATCAQNADVGSNFVWINGPWLFSATSSDPEVLVEFVNLYPY
jgi:hypothetical protein